MIRETIIRENLLSFSNKVKKNLYFKHYNYPLSLLYSWEINRELLVKVPEANGLKKIEWNKTILPE